MEWAIAITEKVNQITSLNVGLWTPILSPAVGSLSFGCAVETLTDIENGEAKLLADPMYLDAAQRGAELTTGQLDDRAASYVSGGGDIGFNPTHVAVVQSQLANQCLARGVAAGIAIAERATELSGLPTAFLVGTTGGYGDVAWITSAQSLADLEAGEQKTNFDPDFVKMVDDSADCFLPGVTTQEIWRRIV
jgi:hypothetical protein